jgi:hypothetical protein
MDGPAKPTGASPRETVRVHMDGELYGIEADAFAACVLDGQPPFVTADHTLGNMRVLNQLRAGFRSQIDHHESRTPV